MPHFIHQDDKVLILLKMIGRRYFMWKMSMNSLGEIRNNTDKTYSYVQVSINLYDKNDCNLNRYNLYKKSMTFQIIVSIM